ncbi:MAG: DUF1415 family protein [Myxococcales bacterium]|nr:DUF1415 family protein [Myxococcales bacterium]
MPDSLERQAERIYRRYATEVVEGLGMCPWAAAARAAGEVEVEILSAERPSLEACMGVLERFGQREQTRIGLLVLPRSSASRAEHARFTARLREADSERCGLGRTIFALADFHPEVEADTRSAERLVPFIRRSPDPTIQAVRRSALAAVRLGAEQGTSFVDPADLASLDLKTLQPAAAPLNKRVARANLATVEKLGIERVRAMMDDILADRDRSYARFGIAPRGAGVGERARTDKYDIAPAKFDEGPGGACVDGQQE